MKIMLDSPLARQTVDLLNRYFRQRGCGFLEPVLRRPACGPCLVAYVNPRLDAEEYQIEMIQDGCLEVSGGSALGLLFGLGRMLQEGCFAGGEFTFGAWRGRSSPKCSLRCVYFATHFYNYYQLAPLSEMLEYVEDLALLGFNAIGIWADKQRFSGIRDPEFRSYLDRIRHIFLAVQALGMKVLSFNLANEGYQTTPEELRAKATGRAHYGCEVCPSTEAGMQLILQNQRDTLEFFSGIRFDYYVLWPYDQGGCGCDACAPWGAKGMLECGERVAALLHEYQPGARIILSTWLYDHTGEAVEWPGLEAAMKNGGLPWVDTIMAESPGFFPRYPLEHGVPGGRPLVNFPEISMRHVLPWGGSGANPMPATHAAVWGQVASRCDGGALYSEGIFEDLNKAVYAGFYWNRDTSLDDTLRRYAALEFALPGRDVVKFRRLLEILEANVRFTLFACRDTDPDHTKSGYRKVSYCGTPVWTKQVQAFEDPEEALAIVRDLEAGMPDWAKTGWRWRLIALRAVIDSERYAHDLEVTGRCADCFEELKILYHADETKTCSWVLPPVRKHILQGSAK